MSVHTSFCSLSHPLSISNDLSSLSPGSLSRDRANIIVNSIHRLVFNPLPNMTKMDRIPLPRATLVRHILQTVRNVLLDQPPRTHLLIQCIHQSLGSRLATLMFAAGHHDRVDPSCSLGVWDSDEVFEKLATGADQASNMDFGEVVGGVELCCISCDGELSDAGDEWDWWWG